MKKENNFAAVLWMMGGISSLSIIAISARELSSGMHPFEMLFIRSVIGLAIISAIIFQKKETLLFKTEKFKIHLLRNVFHFIAQYGWFIGLGILPLAQVFSLEFTTPLWTMLIAGIFLNEKLTLPKIAAVLLGIVGVFIILRPDIRAFNTESLIVLGAALCFAIAHTSTKKLSRTEDTLTVLFYMCLIQLPLGYLLAYQHWVTPESFQWLWLLLMGLAGISAHFCITTAMRYADVGIVISVDFFRLPLIAVVGIIFYSEKFDINILIGGLIMVIGNLYVNYKNKK